MTNVKDLRVGDWVALTPKIAELMECFIDAPAKVLKVKRGYMEFAVLPYRRGVSPEESTYTNRELSIYGNARLYVHKYVNEEFLKEMHDYWFNKK